MMTEAHAVKALEAALAPHDQAAIAVSGGVDSMTLAVVAGRMGLATVFHAKSPAVPAEATARVRHYAARENWRLTVLDAGEFDDPNYRANPANRCYYCKSNLYQAIAERTDAQLLSGTNLDDLGDWRPGLRSAKEQNVRHPFVEAEIDKAGVRRIADALGLHDLAVLPAAPCLSSRIETGLRIEPDHLALVHAVEKFLTRRLSPETVRCRLRGQSVEIELDDKTLADLAPAEREALTEKIASMFAAEHLQKPVIFGGYRMGSAFLRPE